MNIAGTKIHRGEEKMVSLKIALLPSGTAIDTPIVINRAETDGPTVLFSGGLHGDEINGVEIVRRILETKTNAPLKGTIISIPVMNIYGFLHYSRELPDGKDINRMFPGSPHGSLASIIAYQTRKKILPFIDFGVDFHSGGGMHTNFPQIRCKLVNKENKSLAMAFNPPFVINAEYRENSFRKTAMKMRKRILVFEGGESHRFNKHAIDEGLAGAQRLLYHLGMREEAPKSNKKPIVLDGYSWVRANIAGMFHPTVACGDIVKKGDFLGMLTDPVGRYKKEIIAPITGYIIGLNLSPITHHGEALFNIGYQNLKRKP